MFYGLLHVFSFLKTNGLMGLYFLAGSEHPQSKRFLIEIGMSKTSGHRRTIHKSRLVLSNDGVRKGQVTLTLRKTPRRRTTTTLLKSGGANEDSVPFPIYKLGGRPKFYSQRTGRPPSKTFFQEPGFDFRSKSKRLGALRSFFS